MKELCNVRTALEQAVSNKLFGKAVVGVVTTQNQVCFSSIGDNVTSQSVFDIASITKFLVALLWYSLQSKGLLKFEGELVHNKTLVAPMLNMRGQHVHLLTIEHLLCFRTLFNKGFPAKERIQRGFENYKAELLFGGMKIVPGSEFSYGNPHTVLLGLLLEKLMRKPLIYLLQEHIFEPLKMWNTNQYPFRKFTHIIQSEPTIPPGIINDPAAMFVYEMNRQLIGSAGLFSTAEDLLKVLHMLLNKGSVTSDTYVIDSDIVKRLHEPAYDGFGNGLPVWRTFRRNLEQFSIPDSRGLFKLGHTGCVVVTLPSWSAAYVVLTDYLMHNVGSAASGRRGELYRFFASLSKEIVDDIYD